VIAAELRRAIVAAAGQPDADPLLRPGPGPGSYASSLPFRLARPGQDPRAIAAALAATLDREPWIAAAEAAGPGYLTVTVTRDALARLAVRIAQAGPACVTSDALHGRTVPAPAEVDLAAQPDWPRARAALAAQLTAHLAAAAGATIVFSPERTVVPPPAPLPRVPAEPAEPGPPPPLQPRTVAEAIAYAGPDAVRFALARMPPGPGSAGAAPEAAVIAQHVLENPAYAVRYAHAAAAGVLRWAAALGTGPAGPQEFRPRLLTQPEELALLDGLSWLPERVAMAARRGRPDEFAGYLEGLAARTIETMSTTGFSTISSISSERLWLADAARAGLAASLGLLGIGAPRRL
jgi:arginyl-tRNA synthetase